jgi:hypothetical protein
MARLPVHQEKNSGADGNANNANMRKALLGTCLLSQRGHAKIHKTWNNSSMLQHVPVNKTATPSCPPRTTFHDIPHLHYIMHGAPTNPDELQTHSMPRLAAALTRSIPPFLTPHAAGSSPAPLLCQIWGAPETAQVHGPHSTLLFLCCPNARLFLPGFPPGWLLLLPQVPFCTPRAAHSRSALAAGVRISRGGRTKADLAINSRAAAASSQGPCCCCLPEHGG